jgi:hypothetical protein
VHLIAGRGVGERFLTSPKPFNNAPFGRVRKADSW